MTNYYAPVANTEAEKLMLRLQSEFEALLMKEEYRSIRMAGIMNVYNFEAKTPEEYIVVSGVFGNDCPVCRAKQMLITVIRDGVPHLEDMKKEDSHA
jgi:hypothetical protein